MRCWLMSRSTPTLTGPMLLPLNLPLPWVPQIRAPSRKHFTLPLAYPCLCLFAAYPDLDVHRFAESLTLLQKCPRPSVPIQPCPLLVVPCSLFVLNVASLDVGPPARQRPTHCASYSPLATTNTILTTPSPPSASQTDPAPPSRRVLSLPWNPRFLTL